MKRAVLALFLGVAVAGILSLPAAAQQYPPQPATILLFNSNNQQTQTFSPGELVRMFADGLIPSTTYDFLFSQSPGTNIGNATTSPQGQLINAQFRIPTTARAGAATLTLDPRGVAGNTHSVGLTIRAGAAPPTVGLPKTGSSLDLFVGSGTVLLLAGIVMVLSVRRRRHLARLGSDDSRPVTVGT